MLDQAPKQKGPAHIDQPEVMEREVDGTLMKKQLEELYALKEELLGKIERAGDLKYKTTTQNLYHLQQHKDLQELKNTLEEVQTVITYKQGNQSLELGNHTFQILPEESERVPNSPSGRNIFEMSNANLATQLTDLARKRVTLDPLGEEYKGNLAEKKVIEKILDERGLAQRQNEKIIGANDDVWENRS